MAEHGRVFQNFRQVHQYFTAGSRKVDIDGGPDAKISKTSIQHQLHVTGIFLNSWKIALWALPPVSINAVHKTVSEQTSSKPHASACSVTWFCLVILTAETILASAAVLF